METTRQKIDFTAYEIRDAFERAKPKKISYDKKTANASGYRRNHSLDNYEFGDSILQHVFLDSSTPMPVPWRFFHVQQSFAEDHLFVGMKKRDPKVLEELTAIKNFYHNNIVKYNLEPGDFIKNHIRPLTEILDTRLDEEEFLKRARLIRRNLEQKGITSIEGGYKESEKKLDAIVAPMKQEAKERYQRKDVMRNPEQDKRMVGGLIQNMLDEMRYDREMIKQAKRIEDVTPKKMQYIPSIRTFIKDYIGNTENQTEEKILKKVSAILDQSSDRLTSEFEIKKAAERDTINYIIQKSATASRKAIKLGDINLDSKTIGKIASYYNMNKKVRDFLLDKHKNYALSLVDLINNAYSELIRTPGILN